MSAECPRFLTAAECVSQHEAGCTGGDRENNTGGLFFARNLNASLISRPSTPANPGMLSLCPDPAAPANPSSSPDSVGTAHLEKISVA
ncbi:hypothetical protein GYMLUDRAFT_245653 [Collybiopsis luxurians FD-317 M1]|uniref:Uncharacterized protein n=1 Tax=Collybiopsis luxurians FD-317 M1 TaxID=944289 RepID=A0A0D0C8Q9_9AGAR|nr:hypothetical protein GYMLUDRAFT_245653 [Collybiopsis luxurians FD-317 M1]